ncbi:hypothetical protein EVG20_g4270 [Dentipellis fragilis]|uniref:Uncharacterized protein n=1 Tax=Dentipellis fragilis TaxID=205917 RepID=A0A4Y9YW55_9AGAM|nr:hypothetical protein EVG20_g4270 [Dentipellis fragilis]
MPLAQQPFWPFILRGRSSQAREQNSEAGRRTGAGAHLSAFAAEPAGPLFLPLLSHTEGKLRESAGAAGGWIARNEAAGNCTVADISFRRTPQARHPLRLTVTVPRLAIAQEMGKKRKRVAAALHSELLEYASLIRVLRTNDALDVVPHLTTPATFTPVDDDDGESEKLPSGALSQREPSMREDDQESEMLLSGKTRDTWTRWPLMAGDVHVPEWSFEDEVRLIAQQTLDSQASLQPASASSGLGQDSQSREASHVMAVDGEDDEDARLPASAVHNLATAASIHLEQILSAIASHTPTGREEHAKQAQASWMGECPWNDADRALLVSSSRKELSETLKPYDLSFLEYPSIPTKGQRGDTVKRPRGPYGKRSKSVKEESEASDSSSDDKPLAKRTAKDPIMPWSLDD